MKNYNEIANIVLSRRDKYNETQRIKRNKIIRISSFASCFVLISVLGIGIWQSGLLDINSLPKSNPLSQEGIDTETANNTITQEQTTKIITEITTEQSTLQKDEVVTDGGDTDSGGEIGNGWFIPAIPFNTEIELVGEAISDAEAQAYFNKNKNSIIGSLSASGISSNSIQISDKGYCHVTYNGEEGKSFEIRQNYRDYHVFNGDKLIAIITLYKENGELFNTPSFGAKWFDDYNAYLQAHKGEKIVYVYAGWFEIIVAPDNTYFNPMGHDVSPYLDGIENPYELFYHETATYVP